jgi:tRNA dimethylallyltransferase
MKEIALIGPTASGKSALSIEIAKEIDAYILSLDSLSIYREIDIASAKPTLQERGGVIHFGIDIANPDENFDVTKFFDIYREAKELARERSKNLVIVGGSSFYLKAMIEGVTKSVISKETKELVKEIMLNLPRAYQKLQEIDSQYAKKLYAQDRYRVEKALLIYYQHNITPSDYFANFSKERVLEEIDIFEIDTDRALLRERIKKRTQNMLQDGLLDEVFYLQKRYSRDIFAMKTIGIRESLDYFDGYLNRDELVEKIVINTARLAKKQVTFNKTQFPKKIKMDLNSLKIEILRLFRYNG